MIPIRARWEGEDEIDLSGFDSDEEKAGKADPDNVPLSTKNHDDDDDDDDDDDGPDHDKERRALFVKSKKEVGDSHLVCLS